MLKKKSTKARCKICPKNNNKGTKATLILSFKCLHCLIWTNFPSYSSFSILTLNSWMLIGICCIHFHICRSSRADMFFKKGALRIFREFTGENPCNCGLNFIEITVLDGCSSTNMLHICSRTEALFLALQVTYAWWPKKYETMGIYRLRILM